MLIDENQASVRVSDTRRLMWTLTSLAVRIAQAMNLHHERSSSFLRPFGREMRRRLWWQICLLDSHAAEDRATNPVIFADSFSTRLPLQINDEDIRVDSHEEVEERQGFTDMTFSLICYEITDTTRQLNYVPVRNLGQCQFGFHENWTCRIDAVISLQRHIEENHLRHLNLARPFHWATRMVADIITAIMWLIVYRPLQQRLNNNFSSRPVDPDILSLSVVVLEKVHQLNTDPAASPYRWLSHTYVQWHALAVTVAELCVRTEGSLVERAWAVLIPVFRQASQHVADSDGGMIWRPIKKLMSKARGLRKEHLDLRSATDDSSARMANWSVPEHGDHPDGAGGPVFGIVRDAQGANHHAAPSVEGPRMPPLTPNSAPFDWNTWLAAASTSMESSLQSQYNNETAQQAWTNWDNFVTVFQGQDEGVIDGLNDEGPEYPSFW